MTYSWNFITDEYFYNYAGNHVMFPMVVAFLYQTQKPIHYWNTFFFSFFFVALWEIVEVLLYLVFGSFLLFGNDNESMESVENVVILDLGNGIIGIGIALLTMLAIKPVFKEINWWYKAILFIAYGIVYSMLSTYGICQTESCDHLPFGNIINYFVVLLFGFIMYLYVVNDQLVYAFVFNAFLINSATMIQFQSSVIMIYITSALLLLFWTVFYFATKTEYNQVNNKIEI